MATPSYDSDSQLTDASQSDNEFEARLLRRSREFVDIADLPFIG